MAMCKASDPLVVGVGLASSVVAHELADGGNRVRIIDCCFHLDGDAYDEFDASGVLVDSYGPHIFQVVL